MKRKPQFMTLDQFSKTVRLSKKTVYEMCKKGRIEGAFQAGDGDNAPWIFPSESRILEEQETAE